MTKPHKWQYTEIAPAAGDEHPRPAQRCARCGLVRRQGVDGWHYPALATLYINAEPPCTPERPAEPILAP